MSKTRDASVGCILIEDPLSGESALSGLSLPPEIQAFPFAWRAEERSFPVLQTLLQQVRGEYGSACILARGAGCMAALALAEQLPVERLALVEPVPARRQARRIALFAMSNLALCVSDALIVARNPGRMARRIARGIGFHGRAALLLAGKSGDNLYTNREKIEKDALIGFLRDGVFPKELAQNPEMCIIYG